MTPIRRRFHAVLFSVAFALLGVTVVGYRLHHYSGDFYSFHAALTNLLAKGSFESFPLYENLFGVHSYLTLPLLAPLTHLFATPLLFPLLSVGIYFVSCLLFFEICLHLNGHESDDGLPFLFGCLFLSFPLVIHFAAPVYDPFEPDFLVLPLLLALFWAMLTERRFVFYSAFSFLLLTKEEFIVLAPVFVFLLWRLLLIRYETRRATWFDAVAVIAINFVAALLSAGILARYRALNEIKFFVRTELYPSLLLDKGAWLKSFGALARTLGPIVPFVALLFARADKRTAWFFGFCLLLFPVGRELLAIVTYPESIPFYAHWRIVLAPMILLPVVVVSYTLREKQRLSSVALARGAMLGIALNLGFGLMLKGSVRDRVVQLFARQEFEEKQAQAREIHRWVGDHATPNEVLVLPEELYPWFYRRGDLFPTPALFPWQRHHPREIHRSPFFVLEKIEDRVRFVVIHRNEPEPLKRRIAETLTAVSEAGPYLIYARTAQ